MSILVIIASLLLIGLVLIDSFETTVLPRRVTHRFRFTRLFYMSTWRLWRGLAFWVPSGKWREAFLSLFGPLSLLGILATWVIGLILAFALLHWSAGTGLEGSAASTTLARHVYWSGSTFFTLGYGDVTPASAFGRFLAVIEAGMGLGFLAIIIGYLPAISQVFSRREVMIALLDARAGSPPSAGQFLLRLAQGNAVAEVEQHLAAWERWSAELLESHLSFPVLSYYRSQHDNQSWLAALTAVLDICAFVMTQVKDGNPYQARLTFAMARHAAVDLALVFRTPPVAPEPDRLPEDRLQQLREQLRQARVSLHDGPELSAKLADLRGMYEPFVNALAGRFLFALPAFIQENPGADNWQRSAWLKRAPALGSLSAGGDEHF